MSIDYFVVCTAELPRRSVGWDEPFGPVSIAPLPPSDPTRMQLEARFAGTPPTGVIVFSARAVAGHLAFQLATALAKMASGLLFDEESLDEPLTDYRGHPSVVLSGGIEVIWQAILDTDRRADELRIRREMETWQALRLNDPRTEEENDWLDAMPR